jgi:hypothetical protein
MYLVVLHPDQKNYERIQVAPLDSDIEKLFAERGMLLAEKS